MRALDELKKVQHLRHAILFSPYAHLFTSALQYYDMAIPVVAAQTFEALAKALKPPYFPQLPIPTWLTQTPPPIPMSPSAALVQTVP